MKDKAPQLSEYYMMISSHRNTSLAGSRDATAIPHTCQRMGVEFHHSRERAIQPYVYNVALGKSSGMNVSRYRVQDMEVKMERVRLNILMREGQSP
jgi:hypothetical protein